MKPFRIFGLLMLLFAFQVIPVFAQTEVAVATAVDSAATDSAALAQKLMQEHAQQAFMDSLIRSHLTEEMSNLSNDSKRKLELESQLAVLQTKDSLRQIAQKARIAQLKLKSPGYAVAPFGDTLFMIFTKLGSFSPKDRAENTSARMIKLYKERDFARDSLRVIASEGGFDIYYGRESIVTSVTEMDALWLEAQPAQLAQDYASKIGNAVYQEQVDNSLYNWLRRLGLVLLIVGSAIGLIFLVRKVFKFLERFLVRHQAQYFKGLKIGHFKLFGPDQQLRYAMRLLRILQFTTIIIAVYLALPLLFSVFPDTKVYADTLIGWVLSPAKRAIMGLIHFLPNLFTIIVVFLITRYSIKAVKFFSTEIEHGNFTLPGFHQDWAVPTFNIVKFIMYAFMLVIIFPYLPGSESPAFQGVSVFLGILLSLGSSSAITNIIAGLVITYMRPFKIGDRVKIGEVTGDVMEKTMLVTRILTIKNEDITVPNSTVLNSHTINYSSNAPTTGLILHSTVTIGYDVPWRKMHEVLIKAALRTEGVMADPQPFVLQTSLDDFYVSYQINAFTRDASRQAVLYSLLHQNIQDCCNEADIEILSPHYRAMRDGNMVTIPANYLPKEYVAPSFGFHQVEPQSKKD